MTALRKIEQIDEEASLNLTEIASTVTIMINKVLALFDSGNISDAIEARGLLYKSYIKLRNLYLSSIDLDRDEKLFLRDCMREVMCVYCDERNFPRNKNLIADFVQIFQLEV